MKLPRTAGLAGIRYMTVRAVMIHKPAGEEYTAAPAVAEQRAVFVGPPRIAAIAGLGVVEIGSGRGIAGPVDFHSDR
jgi:hypothetical protein